MVGNLLFARVSFGLFAFMVNRLYVDIGEYQINVKGVTYFRFPTLVMYWIVMTMALFGLALGLLIAWAITMMLI